MIESDTPVLDGIISDIGESETLDLTGYPKEVLIVAVRETFGEFASIVRQLNSVYTTLGLLLGEIDEQLNPSEAEVGDTA